jgi:plastocyanin
MCRVEPVLKGDAVRDVHHLRVALVAVALTSGLAACGSSSKKSSAALAITIQNFSFSPTPLSAKVGDTITVTNKDSAPHTFTADDGSFNTGTLSSGTSKPVKVPKAGTIAYHCNIHSSMHGTLQVS